MIFTMSWSSKCIVFMFYFFYRNNNASGEGIKNTRPSLKPLNLKDVSKIHKTYLLGE